MAMKNENCDCEQNSIVHYIIVNTVLTINIGVICTVHLVQYSEVMSCKILCTVQYFVVPIYVVLACLILINKKHCPL